MGAVAEHVNGNGAVTVPPRRAASRGIAAVVEAAARMSMFADALEADGQAYASVPAVCEAYSECVAILRDGAADVLKRHGG